MEPRVIKNPELEFKARNIRGNTWFWCDKKITRFLRKNFSRKHYSNFRSIYLALCEIDSDFFEGKPIRGFKRTLCTYAGRHIDVVSKYFYIFKILRLVEAEQFRDSEGHFGQSRLYMSEWTDQDLIYENNKEWISEFLEEERPNIAGDTSVISEMQTITTEERCTGFPVHRVSGYPENHAHKKQLKAFKEEVNTLEVKTLTVAPSALPVESTNLENNDKVPSPNETLQTVNTNTKTISKKQQCFIDRAKRLAEIVSAHININKSSQVNTWWTYLEKLHRIDGVSLKRIDTAIEWFSENIADQFTPRAHSGRAFREDFSRIEDAMKRCNSKKSNVQSTTREEFVKQQNLKLGTHITHGVDDTFKDVMISKKLIVQYFTVEEPDDNKFLTYDVAVDMIKQGLPSPAKTVDSFYNRVKVLENL